MVKVLIYSSKEIYDKASYVGRAEAHLIAYRIDGNRYKVVKNRYETHNLPWSSSEDLNKYGEVYDFVLRRHIERVERNEWQRDMDAFKREEKLYDKCNNILNEIS